MLKKNKLKTVHLDLVGKISRPSSTIKSLDVDRFADEFRQILDRQTETIKSLPSSILTPTQ